MRSLFVFFILKCVLHVMSDPSVFLTVEDKMSLVGEHCPGTVRLFCEGVDLVNLRWRYNEANAIYSFLADSIPSRPILLESNPAFLSVQLTAISQQYLTRTENFSSILVVNVEQLHRNKIDSISCGDVKTFETIPIDLVTIYETTLRNPEVSFISVWYSHGLIQSLQISWIKLQPACPEHILKSISYMVELVGIQSKQVNYNACEQLYCEANLDNITKSNYDDKELQLRLSMSNIGDDSSDLYETRRYIANTSNEYLIVEHNFDHTCQLSGICTSPLNTSSVIVCSITYRNNVHQVLLHLSVQTDEIFTINALNAAYYEAVIRANHSDINEVHIKNNFTVGPSSPEIVKVLLLFSSKNGLTDIQVDWVNIMCGFDSLQYELRVAMEARVLSTNHIRSDECMPTMCTIRTPIANDHLTKSLGISLVAINSEGRNRTGKDISPIYQLSAFYYRPSIQLLNCTALQINCSFNNREVSNDTKCICEYYAGDYLYKHLQSKQDLSSNNVLTLQETTTILHYFILKSNIRKMFELQEEFFYPVHPSCTKEIVTTVHSLSMSMIITIAAGLASFVCFCCTFVLTISIAVVVSKRRKKNRRKRNAVNASERKNKSQSPTPVYEEIKMSQFKEMETFQTNEAYGYFFQEPTYSDVRH